MSDFISEFNKAQVEFAQQYVDKIIWGTPREVKSTMGDGEFALLASNVKRNALLSMQGYANWLACKLVRSQNFKKQALPVCDEKAVVWVSAKYDVPVEFVKAFVLRIIEFDTEFPLVGKITYHKGEFHPNEVALRKYEASFGPW